MYGQVDEDRLDAVYDFVLDWDDGTSVRLHPQWCSAEVQCLALPQEEQLQATPELVQTIRHNVWRTVWLDTAKHQSRPTTTSTTTP